MKLHIFPYDEKMYFYFCPLPIFPVGFGVPDIDSCKSYLCNTYFTILNCILSVNKK